MESSSSSSLPRKPPDCNGQPVSILFVPPQEICRQILARNGADINAVTDNGRTPLHLASRRGHTEFVEVVAYLLRLSGIDICFDG